MWLLVMASPGLAWAQVTSSTTMSGTPPSDTPSIALGTTIYADYTYQKSPKITDSVGNSVSLNSFNVTRAYINVIGNLSHVVQFRVTPDITRETSAAPTISGSLVFRIKYTFLQLNLDDWTGNFKGSWLRVGIQQTPIIDWLEQIYRYRFQGTTFIEREQTGTPFKQLSSSDAGVSFHTNLPSNYGDVHFGLYNGEAYGAAEPNNEKSFQIRGTFRPFGRGSMAARGWRVTGFYDNDSVVKNAQRDRAIFDTTYEHKHFSAGFDYLNAKDQAVANGAIGGVTNSRGWSFWATPFFKQKGNGPEALIRYDDFTPNTAAVGTDGNAPHKHRLIAGLAYWFPHPGGNQTAAMMLNLDRLQFTSSVNSGATATVTKIMLSCLINY
jgi:hypothetical protein